MKLAELLTVSTLEYISRCAICKILWIWKQSEEVQRAREGHDDEQTGEGQKVSYAKILSEKLIAN